MSDRDAVAVAAVLYYFDPCFRRNVRAAMRLMFEALAKKEAKAK